MRMPRSSPARRFVNGMSGSDDELKRKLVNYGSSFRPGLYCASDDEDSAEDLYAALLPARMAPRKVRLYPLALPGGYKAGLQPCAGCARLASARCLHGRRSSCLGIALGEMGGLLHRRAGAPAA